MDLFLHRVEEDPKVLPGRENKRTRGSLFLGTCLWMHILEDEVRRDDPSTPKDEGAKVKGRSAIPAGRYEIKLTWSPKYGRVMPEIMAVPGFTGIRIHSGHDETHTEGCLLTAGGFDAAGDIIGGTSKKHQEMFESVVMPAIKKGEQVFITITNDFLNG